MGIRKGLARGCCTGHERGTPSWNKNTSNPARGWFVFAPRERNTLVARAATPRTTVRNRDAHQKPTECAAGTTGNRATRPRLKTACFVRSSWCLIMGSRTCTPRRHVSASCPTRDVPSSRRYRPHTARRSLLRVRPPLEDIRFSDLRL